MWEQVELRELQVFLTISEHLHFGRAAEQLHVSHSRVSQILQELETKLGVRLFDRSSRRVTLTPSGTRLRDEIQQPYSQLRQVLRDAQASAGQATDELRLGLLFPSSGGPRLAQIIERFERRHPGAKVKIRDLRFDDPLGPLRRGEIDVMACRLPITQPDLTVGPTLASDERILAVAINHPLADRDSISVEDLAGCKTHDAGGRLPREYLDELVPPRTPRGRRIRRQHIDSPSPTQVLAMVARGEIVHPTISSFPDHYRHPGVTFVPIRDLPPMKAGLVWRTSDRTSAVHAFAQAAIDTITPHDAQTPPARRAGLRDQARIASLAPHDTHALCRDGIYPALFASRADVRQSCSVGLRALAAMKLDNVLRVLSADHDLAVIAKVCGGSLAYVHHRRGGGVGMPETFEFALEEVVEPLLVCADLGVRGVLRVG
jgi:DNA-binding transcriptional LysR family regulator